MCPSRRISRILIYGECVTEVCEAKTELAREIQLPDWSTVGNLSNRSSGVQIHVIFVLILGVIYIILLYEVQLDTNQQLTSLHVHTCGYHSRGKGRRVGTHTS